MAKSGNAGNGSKNSTGTSKKSNGKKPASAKRKVIGHVFRKSSTDKKGRKIYPGPGKKALRLDIREGDDIPADMIWATP